MIDIPVIYQNDELLILNKPAFITVNRSQTTENSFTVQDFVEQKLGKKNYTGIDDFSKRAGIVHRLDKETSGILIVAKTVSAFENLQQQFKDRKVDKSYLALAHGYVTPQEGDINVPIGRIPWDRTKFGVLAGGRQSFTSYKVIKLLESSSGERFSFLRLYPKTGRTHQIRVHLKYINHPVFSDSLYAGRKTARDDRNLLQRIFLHASTISFYDPKTGAPISFTSNLPQELDIFINKLTLAT